MPAEPLTVLIALACGYLAGSVPFGLILTRLFGKGDIRAIGSGNIGATNVLRTGSKGLALATFLGDAGKGFAAWVVAAQWSEAAAMAAGLGAFAGHVHPVWLGFRGGKGVATYLGVLAGAYPPAALGFAAAWLATAFATRRSSPAALVAAALVPVGLWLTGLPALAALFGALSAWLIWRHRANISRLIDGTEPRIGAK